ncbi:MAG: hypothetical protein LBH54_00465, partial [Clostridiales bacterium]|nr:hypothetical protein [Clostridiales bacterium]
DHNRDGEADTVIVSSYKTYFVSKTGALDLSVTDQYLQPPIRLDDGRKYRILRDGEEVRLDAVKANTVLMVYADREKLSVGGAAVIDEASTLYTMILCADTVTGTVDEADAEGNVSIDGVLYKQSAQFRAAANTPNGGVSPVKAGDFATYYLDNYGRIAGTLFDKRDLGGYGFLAGIDDTARLSSVARLKIFTADGVMKIYEIQKKAEFGGVKGEPVSSIVDQIKASGKVKQLIHYTVNDDGRITALSTATDNTGNPPGAAGDRFSLDRRFDSVEVMYHSGTLGSLYRLGHDAKIFKIPVDLQGEVLSEDKYFAMTSFSDMTKYKNLELYDISANDLSVRAVVLLDDSAAGGGDAEYKQDIFIVDKVARAINDDGEETVKIKGFRYGAEAEVAAQDLDLKMGDLADGEMFSTYRGVYAKDLRRGDVIQITQDSLGYVSTLRVLAHDVGGFTRDMGFEGINNGVINDMNMNDADYEAPTQAYYPVSYFGIGMVDEVLSNVALVHVDNKNYPEKRRSYFAMEGQTTFYAYDVAADVIYPCDFGDVAAGDILAVQIREGRTRTMYIVKK